MRLIRIASLVVGVVLLFTGVAAVIGRRAHLAESRDRTLQAVGDVAVALSADERWLVGTQVAIGVLLLVMAVGSGVSEHRALHRRATRDALTGLANRGEFEHQAAAALARARRAGHGACVMLVDLDRFKLINDTEGHHAGDRVLAAAAGRLRGAVRESDLVGRWGGDEFVVLLDGVDDPAAVAGRAAAIQAALAAAGDPEGAVSASVGAALFPQHGSDLDALVRAADAAMYAAKGGGVTHRLAV